MDSAATQLGSLFVVNDLRSAWPSLAHVVRTAERESLSVSGLPRRAARSTSRSASGRVSIQEAGGSRVLIPSPPTNCGLMIGCCKVAKCIPCGITGGTWSPQSSKNVRVGSTILAQAVVSSSNGVSAAINGTFCIAARNPVADGRVNTGLDWPKISNAPTCPLCIERTSCCMFLNPAALEFGREIAALPNPTHWLLTCLFSVSTTVKAAVASGDVKRPFPPTATARVPAFRKSWASICSCSADRPDAAAASARENPAS